MTQQQILKRRLEELDAPIPRIFRGDGSNTSAEQIAGTINQALDAIELGDYEILNDED